ncbi:MAG: tRNA1(Val) (adenine(37)-N6)-methyltransferase [Lachnospiraceae bacterium]|nr:tRNA1(Val) (adenine(37)-N6)-methyltransferase [Lachnospiraceae bacterium]
MMNEKKERIDDLQRNGYRIIQNPDRFCFGMDAVLLTGFARCSEEDIVLDMGTGTGIIPILMEAKYGGSAYTGLEIQEESADMARRSVELNSLSDKIEIICGDIREAAGLFKLSSFDVITCNPPYMADTHGIKNPKEPKAVARHEICCTLEDVLTAAAKLLKPGGHFYMVHRPARLAEIICGLKDKKLEPKRMRLVYPKQDKEPNMVLIESVRGGKSGLRVEAPLILMEPSGEYTEEIKRDYGF